VKQRFLKYELGLLSHMRPLPLATVAGIPASNESYQREKAKLAICAVPLEIKRTYTSGNVSEDYHISFIEPNATKLPTDCRKSFTEPDPHWYCAVGSRFARCTAVRSKSSVRRTGGPDRRLGDAKEP